MSATAWGWILLALLGFGTRVVYLAQISGSPLATVLLGDAEEYHAWAHDIRTGDPSRNVVFYQAPVYPYFLALVYTIAGDGWWWRQLAQAAIGTGTCLLAAGATRRIFGPAAGWTSGVLLALHPTLIFFDGLMQKTVFDVFLAALVLALLAWTEARRTSPWPWLAVGAGIGLWTLSRENALLVGLPVAVWLGVQFNLAGQQRLLRFACLVLGLALILSPVALRNRVVGGQWALTTSQLGPNLYIGNHPGASGTYEPLVPDRGHVQYERLDATRLAEQALGRSLSPTEVSSYWVDRVWHFARGQPIDWLQLQGKKLLMVFHATEMVDTEDQYTYGSYSPLLALLTSVIGFGIWLALAGVGVVATCRRWPQVWIWYALPLMYAASVAVFYVVARYRAPLIPLMAPLVGIGAVELLGWIRQRNYARLVPAAIAVLLCLTVANIPGESTPQKSSAVTWTNLGQSQHKRGNYSDALECYARALRLDPQNFHALHNQGVTYSTIGDHERALHAYEAALKQRPNSAEAIGNKGRCLMEFGRLDEAIQWLRRSLELDPTASPVHYNLGNALRQRFPDDPAVALEALEHYETAVQCDPREPRAWLNLGAGLADMGRHAEAVEKYQRSLELEPDRFEAYVNLGNALRALERYDEAARNYQRAISLQPESFRPYVGLGELARRQQQFGEAAAYFEAALNLVSSDDIAVRARLIGLIDECRRRLR